MKQSSEKIIKKFTSRMQARLLLVFCVISLLLMVLIGRLIYLSHSDGERYAKQVLSRQTYVSAILPYKRGEILDRNGTVLARSELRYKLILDPKYLLLQKEENIKATKEALLEHFAIDSVNLETILTDRSKSQYVVLLKNLQHDEVTNFKEILKDKKSKIKGIRFEEEYVRNYPFDTLASDVIGFTSADNVGYFGIEEYYNNYLNGKNGREYGYYDSSLNIERTIKRPEHGNTIVTTIDANIQRIIQKHIKEFNTNFGSLNIGVLVMNPNNGDIIAMASNKEYNLNSPRNLEGIFSEEEINAMTQEQKMEELNKIWRNDVISFNYEPGSTFKPVTVAAALEEAVISDSDTFFCDGHEYIGSKRINCSNRKGHGLLTLRETLMKSCNDAMMQIVKAKGKDMFFDYQTRFGFGSKTGIDLPGEEAGIRRDLKSLKEIDLAISSFGQTFNVTMIQLAAAYSSLVNGGYHYTPHVMKQVLNDSGATVEQLDKVLVRQTVSKETSKLIQDYMYHTVEEGTAQGAKVPGYKIGGKTGTAQKIPRDAGTYLVSFIGSVPAYNPELVIYVIIDEPQNVTRQDDSSLATKLAGRILKEILPFAGIYPEGDIDYMLPGFEVEQASENQNSNPNQNNNATQNNNTNQNNNTTQNNNENPNNNEAIPNGEQPTNQTNQLGATDPNTNSQNELNNTETGSNEGVNGEELQNLIGEEEEETFNGEAIESIDE